MDARAARATFRVFREGIIAPQEKRKTAGTDDGPVGVLR